MFDWKNFKKHCIIFVLILFVLVYVDTIISHIISQNWFGFWMDIGSIIVIFIGSLMCAIIDKKRELRIKKMKKVIEIWLDDEGKYRAGTVDNSCLDVLMHILNLINQAGEELCKERSQIKIKKEIGDNK